jgi:hypothetical protein
MSIPRVYNDLLEACKQPGCPVCRLVNQAVERYLDNLFYENVNDGDLRAQLRSSLGFCHGHAWLALKPGIGDALGVAIIYHDVLTNILRKLPETESGSQDQGWLSSLLGQMPRQLSDQIKEIANTITPNEPCPACQKRDQATELYLSELFKGLKNEQMLAALRDSDGLCLPHLHQAFKEHAQDGEAVSALFAISQKKLAELDKELAEIIRKSDYRFRDEGFGEEGDAWRRVIRVSVGEKRGIEGQQVDL